MSLQGYKEFRLSSRELCHQHGAETEADNSVPPPAWAAWGCRAAVDGQAVCRDSFRASSEGADVDVTAWMVGCHPLP